MNSKSIAYCENIEGTEGLAERRWWVRELNLWRASDGFYKTNFEQMKEKDPEHFFKITRMTWGKPIEPSPRLFLVLLYLSQGVPKEVLAWIFRMGYSTVCNITYETCDILWESLMSFYLSPPTEDDWTNISTDFDVLWNLPNCVGAIDGKQINIQCPPGAGSEYYNYKGHHSIVLLAICDAKYTFTTVDIEASSFERKVMGGDLNLTPPKSLPNSNFCCNHYLVGDAAFPLKQYLMRPFPGRLLDDERYYFNKRLFRARRVIENAFGVLVSKWRILGTTLHMLHKNADKIVKATTVLHNFVKLNDAAYSPAEFVDSYNDNGDILARGLWRSEIMPLSQSAPIGSHPEPLFQ